MIIGEIVKGEVTSLAFGGQGIVRHNGLVIFVPFTAIGDLITCRLTKIKKNYAEGELIDLLQASADRVTPPCPYFGTCGGCQLQHISYEAQLAYKRQSVEDALRRIGGLNNFMVPPVTASSLQWHYRRRINLKLKVCEKGFTAGFITTDNQTLLSIRQCQIFNAINDPLIPDIQNLLSQIESEPGNHGSLTLLKQDPDQYILHFSFNKLPHNAIREIEKAFKVQSKWTYALVTAPGKTWSIGELLCQLTIDDLTFRFSPRSFIQNHPEQSLNIYREIVRLAKDSTTDHVLDLYCGVGISSLLMARTKRSITGIESNGQAIVMAKENQKENELVNVEFIENDVEKALKGMLKNKKADFVITNPPRIGMADGAINALLEIRPKEIVYVSCMPPTLARDLGKFLEKGYRVSHCAVYDMFPQTAHVETLIYLN